MKPFWGTDLTTDKKNETRNGREFLVQEPTLALASSLDDSAEQVLENINRANLPLFFIVLQGLCGLAALITVGGILRAMAEISIVQAYRNAPWLFWIGGICAVIWGILSVLERLKTKSVLDTDENACIMSRLKSVGESVYAELGVPAHAKDVDVLSFFYKVKDDTIKVKEIGMQIAPYFNLDCKAFADNEHLYLADHEGKYAFPLSAITAIRTVEKRIRIEGWNKEVSHNKGIYKPYKLRKDDWGCIHCKPYHIVEIQYNGETYGIYIPSYELPVFEQLTGRKAQP
ncbi:MAG: hypothetical protein IJY28_08245 [Clostridia bacterium]|nr:hypothetical protein [Clostridia bacterium]